MMPTKICGITSLNDALLAYKNGVSALGFIFYEPSPRNVEVNSISQWIHKIPKHITKVAVFVNQDADIVNNIVDKLSMDVVQLHGNESPDYCMQITKPVMKAFRIKNEFSLSDISKYNVFAYLFDTYDNDEMGGTGKSFNWDLISNLHTQIPVILSGGLNNSNIIDGINTVQPSAVDINSGVEVNPGQKDSHKIKEVMDTLKKITSKSNIFSKQQNEL